MEEACAVEAAGCAEAGVAVKLTAAGHLSPFSDSLNGGIRGGHASRLIYVQNVPPKIHWHSSSTEEIIV